MKGITIINKEENKQLAEQRTPRKNFVSKERWFPLLEKFHDVSIY